MNIEIKDKKDWKEKGKSFIKTVFWLIASMGIAFALTTFIGQRVIVRGESMYPNLKDGENLILDKISYRFTDPERFDIVVFPGEINEYGSSELYIKRVIGLPGETVEIKDGSVYIDGKLLDDKKYTKGQKTDCPEKYSKVTLKENEFYCMGDNREVSEDCRYFGPVTLDKKHITNRSLYRIIGKVPFRVWPIKRLTHFK